MSLYTSILTAGTNSHQETSENANAVATDFVSQGVIGAITNTSGVAPSTGAFAVNAQGTPNMTVAVSSGIAWVQATPTSQNSQMLRVRNTASANVTISANSSGSTKYDWVYIQIDATKAANPASDASDVATLVTSRSSSSSVDNGTPPTYGYCIAVVTVANGASSITNGNIADKRTSTGATPGDATILPYHFFGQSAKGSTQSSSWASQSWTPSWTNVTVGNGTNNSKYFQIAKLVVCRLNLVLGSTSSASGVYTFTLPVTSASYPGTAGIPILGVGTIYDTSAGVVYDTRIVWVSTTTAKIIVNSVSTYVIGTNTSATVPAAPGTNDEWTAQFVYESA